MAHHLARCGQGKQIMDNHWANSRRGDKLESPSRYRGFGVMVEQPESYCRLGRTDTGGKAVSMTQTMIGIGVVSAILSGALNIILPAPVPITINSIAFDGVSVNQDRTVRPDNDAGVFWAQWSAQVVEADTRAPLPNCEGSGSKNYAAGRKVVTMSLPVWTGAAGCTIESLPPGQYRLQATWYWGDQQTAAVSQPFEVK